nr:unnamed protein product [Spirometra erinaceieuropaei]
MLSVDVVSLFTSFPQQLAIEVVDQPLTERYEERDEPLKFEHLLELLQHCLKTYFTFGGQMYEHIKGPPMGSTLSGLTAEVRQSVNQNPSFRRRNRQTGRVSSLTLAAWNVRSLLDDPRSNRPERRSALVARELARDKVDIAALSETRFSEQGQLEEVGAGYTFFWSGRPRAERRDAGVAFAIRNDIVGRLPCLPQGINDRLMSFRLPLRQGGEFATIISA